MGFALDHGDLPQILDRAPCTIQMSTVITIPSHGRLMALPTLIQDMINLCKVHTCVYIYIWFHIWYNQSFNLCSTLPIKWQTFFPGP